MPAKDPRPASHFRLTCGAEEMGLFREATAPTSETKVVEHVSVDANGNPLVQKTPGPTSWTNLTLKRGVDEQNKLWEWRKDVLEQGPVKSRRTITLALLDYTGSTIAAYEFTNAWPVKYTGVAFNAGSGDAALEEVELAVEGMKRVS
jgi:phage tail-like protein